MMSVQSISDVAHETGAARDGSAGPEDPTTQSSNSIPVTGAPPSASSIASTSSQQPLNDPKKPEIGYFSQKGKSQKDLRINTRSRSRAPQGSQTTKARSSDADSHHDARGLPSNKTTTARLASSVKVKRFPFRWLRTDALLPY